jgi:hypothetical protein
VGVSFINKKAPVRRLFLILYVKNNYLPIFLIPPLIELEFSSLNKKPHESGAFIKNKIKF